MKCFPHKFLFFQKYHYLIILLFFLNIPLYECSQNINKNYPNIRQLPNGKFLVVSVNGIFICQKDFSNFEQKYIFKESQIIDSSEEDEKIVFSELLYNNNFYVIYLIKKFLYLFDNNKESIIKEIDLTSNLTGSYYNLNLYNDTNTLNCIISYIEKTNNNIYKINFYKIDFLNNNKVTKNFFYDKKNTYISDIYLSCQISYPSLLICFCLKDDSTKISALKFNIKNNFVKESDNIEFYDKTFKKLFGIKSTEPSEKNEILVGYFGFYFYSSNNASYFIYYNFKNDIFKEFRSGYYYRDCDYFEVFNFKNQNNYIFTCNLKKFFGIYKFDNNFTKIDSKEFYTSECENINNYFLFYNYFIEDYNIITDCYTIKNNSNLLLNISFPKENKYLANYIVYDNSFKNFINLNKTKNDFLDMIPNIMNSIEIGENYKINGLDFITIIKATNSTYFDYLTHINFEKCEDILRKTYNIPASEILTILQMEIDNINEQSLINQVEYKIYDENRNPLNLSLCNDTDIQLFYLLKDDLYNLSDYNYFKNRNIDIFNINDPFFNDICQSYSDTKNDIVLEDRIKDIYQNYSLCDEGCTYNEFNLENKTISCNCKVKTNISLEEPSLNVKYFEEIKVDSNFGLIKCYNLVFSFKGKNKNIGFWIFLILVLIHIPLLFIIIYKGIKPIKEFIFNEMVKYGYKRDNKNKNTVNNKNKNNKNNNINNTIKNSPVKRRKKKKLSYAERSSMNNIKLSDKEIVSNININKEIENININENINNANNNNARKNEKNKSSQSTNKKILINNVILLGKSKKKKGKKRINQLSTQGIENNKTNKSNEKGNNIINFSLINININADTIKEYVPQNSFHILNNYTFEEAIKYDMRSLCAIFYIFLLSKQAAFHAFLFRSPLELFPIRLCLFIFIISSDLALNAFFYLDDKISKKYRYAKNLFLFTFSNNITIILLSTLIGFIFMTLFTNLSNSTNKIRDVFAKEEAKLKKNKKYKVTEARKKEIIGEIEKILKIHKFKVIILLTIEFLLILFFWYYVTAFCHVYSSTQLSWIFDSFLSMLSRLIFELLFSLGFAKLYRLAIESNIHIIYKIVLFFYCFG